MSDLKIRIALDAINRVSKPFKSILRSTQKVREGFAETREKVRGLEEASRDLKSFERLREKAARNADALADAQTKAQALGRAVHATGGASAAAAKRFERARARVAKLKSASAETAGSLGEMSSKLRAAGLNTNNLGESHRRLRHRLDKANAELKEHSRLLGETKRKQFLLTKAREDYDRVLRRRANMAVVGAAGVAVGREMVQTGAALIRPGIEFESAMSRVAAVSRVDKASDAFAALNDQAKELGRGTRFTATQAAEGMGFLAMAGLETNEIMAAMPGVLDLSTAASLDLGRTADITSNILSGFNLDATEMGRVGDVLTATFTRSNVDLDMMGNTMSYVAPIAQALGTSLEDTSAMAGLLGNVGIQGSKAGTAMRAIHNRIAAPTRMARDMIRDLGLQTTDAAGNLRPMTEILADVAMATERMGSADRIAVFSELAGGEAGAAMAKLVAEGGAGEIQKFVDILHAAEGETRRVAKTMNDNLEGDLLKVASAWEAIGIEVQAASSGPLREISQRFAEILGGVAQFVAENPVLSQTVFMVAAAIAALVLVFGGLYLVMAPVMGGFALLRLATVKLGVGIRALTGAMAAARVVFPAVAAGAKVAALGIKGMTVALLTNPITLVLAAIAAAGLLIYTYWDGIAEWVSELWGKVAATLSGVWEIVRPFFAWTPLGLLIETWSPILGFFSGIWSSIGDIFGAGVDWLLSKISLLTEPFAFISDAVGSLFGSSMPELPKAKTEQLERMAPEWNGDVQALPGLPPPLAVTPVTNAAAAGSASAPTPDPAPTFVIKVTANTERDATEIARAVRPVVRQVFQEEWARRRSRMVDG